MPNDVGINLSGTKWRNIKILRIPSEIDGTGLMKDNLQSDLDTIPGKPNKYHVQVAAIRGTVSLLKRTLGGTSFM